MPPIRRQLRRRSGVERCQCDRPGRNWAHSTAPWACSPCRYHRRPGIETRNSARPNRRRRPWVTDHNRRDLGVRKSPPSGTGESTTTGGHIDLPAAFRRLAAAGSTRILIEAGGTFAAALIRAGLVDELALFQAGCLIGAEGRAVLGPLGIVALQDAPRLRLIEATTCGPDTLTRWAF